MTLTLRTIRNLVGDTAVLDVILAKMPKEEKKELRKYLIKVLEIKERLYDMEHFDYYWEEK